MGGLFAKLASKKQLRILLLGLDSAGKTTLLRYLTGEGRSNRPMQPPEPTVGFSVETVKFKKSRLDVWDLGGQERQRVLWRHYYTGTNALIFVIDSTDPPRLSEAKEELLRLLTERDLQSCTVLILANKQDDPNAKTREEISSHLQLPAPSPDGVIYANGHQCFVMPISGATGAGVDEAMSLLLDHSSGGRKTRHQKSKQTAKHGKSN